MKKVILTNGLYIGQQFETALLSMNIVELHIFIVTLEKQLGYSIS